MPKCCIKGCDSSKYIGTKNFTYFNFPLHDEILLKKWLDQIDLPNWKPTHHQICSMHFAESDIDCHPNRMQPYLKPTSVPTIFPVQKAITAGDQMHRPRIIRTVPSRSSIKTTNVGINGNGNLPIIRQNPLFLIPTQYPIILPAQFSQLINSQNPVPVSQFSQSNAQNSIQSGQFSKTNTKNSIQITQLSNQINSHSPIQLSQISQIIAQNTVQNCQFSKINTDNPEQVAKFSLINAQNPIQISQISQISSQNPIKISQISQRIVQNLTKTIELSQINAQTSTRAKEILQTNGENSLRTSIKIPCLSSSEIEDLPDISKSLADRSAILQPRLRKILPKPEVSIVPQSNAVPRVFQSEPVCKPDILIVPRLVGNPSGSELSILSRYPDNKRPTLRITINKCYDVSPEIKKDSNVVEKENASTDEDSFDKEITIKNSTANKSVTFRLDRRTGEIVLETREIIKSSQDNDRSKTTRIKRKVDTCDRPSSEKLRQVCVKEQRECSALRKRLRLLRKCHKREQEETQKLQHHLSEFDDKVQKTCSYDNTTLSRLRKKNGESTDFVEKTKKMENCEKLFPKTLMAQCDIKKIEKNPRTIPNCHDDCQLTLSGVTTRQNNGDLEISVKSRDLKKSEIVDEKNDNCRNIFKKNDVNSIFKNNVSTNDNDYKKECLNEKCLSIG